MLLLGFIYGIVFLLFNSRVLPHEKASVLAQRELVLFFHCQSELDRELSVLKVKGLPQQPEVLRTRLPDIRSAGRGLALPLALRHECVTGESA